MFCSPSQGWGNPGVGEGGHNLREVPWLLSGMDEVFGGFLGQNSASTPALLFPQVCPRAAPPWGCAGSVLEGVLCSHLGPEPFQGSGSRIDFGAGSGPGFWLPLCSICK